MCTLFIGLPKKVAFIEAYEEKFTADPSKLLTDYTLGTKGDFSFSILDIPILWANPYAHIW